MLLTAEDVQDGEEGRLQWVWDAHSWVFILSGFLNCLLVALAISGYPRKVCLGFGKGRIAFL